MFSEREAEHMAHRLRTALQGDSSSLGLIPGAFTSRGPLCSAATLRKQLVGRQWVQLPCCACTANAALSHCAIVCCTRGCSAREIGQINRRGG